MTFPFSRDNLPDKLYINNVYVPSANDNHLTLYNPKDGSLVANNTPLAGERDVDTAVDAAEAALPAWKSVSPTERRNILNKFADLVEENLVTLAELTRITMGAPYESFGKLETGSVPEAFRYYAGWIDKFVGETLPQDDGFLKYVRNKPLGVVAGIVPWNGPLGTAASKAAPALATGNCFILKPSEKTPYAALSLGPLIEQAGFPPGAFQVLSGDGTTGALLASHMRIRKISFTGNVPTGKKIQALAASSNLKRVTLELGGKSPAVVFDDCNLENAVNWTVNSICLNSGQVCVAGSKVYVQEGIYDSFLQKYKDALSERAKTIGDPELASTAMGPLADEAQFKRVTGYIERAKQGQGTLALGGERVGDKGYFIQPTMFTDVDSDSEIYREEIFGPVSIVKSFKTEEEVIELSNDTNYGLMAGVFTQDINRALRIASRFDSGMVGVNCMSILFQAMPFGGTKESGIGRECGIHAMRAYTEPKTVMINLAY